MKFSLITATLNRSKTLEILFTSLVSQSYKNFEIILIDQSDDPEAEKNLLMVDYYINKGLDVIYIREKKRGLSRARNIGFLRSTGDVLGFPDDDCWYPDCFLNKVAEIITCQNFEFVCGQYTEPGVINERFSKKGIVINDLYKTKYVNSITLFIKRLYIENSSKLFDENLGAGTSLPTGEETELASRMVLSGKNGKYDPEIIAYHPIDRKNFHDRSFILKKEMARGYVMGKCAVRNGRVFVQIIGGILKLFIKFDVGRLVYRVIGVRKGLRQPR
jgi:glycosyltransferase involved in cell wall biosynthesis